MLKKCTKRKEQLPLLLKRSETDSAWEGSSIRRRNWDEHFILSHESHTHVKLGKKGIKGRRSLIERIYSISKQHWMLCLYNMDCMGTQGEKQPGIKYCLCVYPHHLLKPCTVIHGPQSNSISSESRSNITIPVKHQAHTRSPHKMRIFCQTFDSHGACLSFTIQKNGLQTKGRKRVHLHLSV